jgi:hypothetical protein
MSPVIDYRGMPEQYTLTVEVRLTTKMPMVSGKGQNADFDFHKSAIVTVSNFGALSKIIEQYNELTQQIESERP